MGDLGAPGQEALEPLVGSVLSGDRKSIAALVSAIGPRVLRVVRQVLGPSHPDVEDVVQDAVFAAIEALPGFRGECTALHFVSRIALLTAMNARRRLALRDRFTTVLPHELLDEAAAPGASPSAALVAARRRRLLWELLLELPPAQAEALAMHCVLGYTIAETAASSRVPENTVRGRLVTAKAALRQRLRENAALLEALDDLGDLATGAS